MSSALKDLRPLTLGPSMGDEPLRGITASMTMFDEFLVKYQIVM